MSEPGAVATGALDLVSAGSRSDRLKIALSIIGGIDPLPSTSGYRRRYRQEMGSSLVRTARGNDRDPALSRLPAPERKTPTAPGSRIELMYCTNCGSANSDTARFCRKCGGELSHDEEETRVATRRAEGAIAKNEAVFTITPTMKFVKAGYGIAVLSAFVFVGLIALLLPGVWWLIAVALGILFLAVPAWFHLKQKMTRYTLTDTMIEIDRGLVSRSTQNVPLRRIQDVTVSSTAMQRLLGFGDIVVDNASETGGKVILDNIDSPRKYADMLLEQMRRLDR